MSLAAALLVATLAAPAPAGVSAPLPAGSRLVEVNGVHLHVRTLGAGRSGPAVVLLSGPTDHWHADSGWFALLQPLLARRHRVLAIDRAGHAFSDAAPDGSYARFADDLAALLPRLEKGPVVVVAFASANLALHHLIGRGGAKLVRSVLLVDPDALHPDLVAFYAEQARPFQDAAKLAEYVNAGRYDARAQGFFEAERAHLKEIVPASLAEVMDWPYYDAVARLRTERSHVLARFAETARYDKDVEGAARVPWPAALPVWTYDTDFEAAAADEAKEPAEKEKLLRWRELGTRFVSELPGHCRIASASREHLAPVAEAEKLAALVRQLAEGAACPAR